MPSASRPALAAVLLYGLFAMAVPARAEGPRERAFRIHIGEDDLTHAVERALEGAAARLSRPACASLLGDFRDREGRPLDERLAEIGVNAPAYLGWILFADGAITRRCATRGVQAVSAAGVRVVFVCRSFAQAARNDPASAEAAVIHEALHTLGLGEDPPRSEEITARVRERCLAPSSD